MVEVEVVKKLRSANVSLASLILMILRYFFTPALLFLRASSKMFSEYKIKSNGDNMHHSRTHLNYLMTIVLSDDSLLSEVALGSAPCSKYYNFSVSSGIDVICENMKLFNA